MIMRKLIHLWPTILILSVLLLSGCATLREYNESVNMAKELEGRQKYEEAYEKYKQAYELSKIDRSIDSKLQELSKIISENSTVEGIQAFENKKFKVAKELFNKALRYEPSNNQAAEYRSDAISAYNTIFEKDARAEDLTTQNKWVEAINLLKEIDAAYDDEPNPAAKIDDWRNQGNAYYRKAGLQARQNGDYQDSLRNFELAEYLISDPQSQQELALAKKYVQADEHYVRASQKADQRQVEEAMDELIKAREITADHLRVNQLINQLLPAWSSMTFDAGKSYMDSKQTKKAFEAFSNLYKLNPHYPQTKEFYEKANSDYLKDSYEQLVKSYNSNDFSSVEKYSETITQVDPTFLDTKEIIVRTLLKGFNVFYQRGLQYMKDGNYGKAILCFRSAEQQLAQTKLTTNAIQQAWEKLRETTALKVVFKDFSQQVGDPSVTAQAAKKLQDLLKSRVEAREFKNVKLKFKNDLEKETSYRSTNPNEIDWGTIPTNGYNTAVIYGDIKALSVEKSMRSEWKTRQRRITRKMENPEHAELAGRRDELNSDLEGGVSNARRRQIKAEIKKIEKKLAGLSPVIMLEEIEEMPYQITTYIWICSVKVDMHLTDQSGRQLWALEPYEDILQIEDHVIPPNPQSNDPKEKRGDPLEPHSDPEIKRQVVDQVVENKIFPNIVKSFEDYGLRFYHQAFELYNPEKENKQPSIKFLESIEEYFKFLASYEDKGEDDDLPEKVQQFLDRCISDLWLIR
jgi:tetratricopeptide (TPR) repeat protein